MKRNLFALCHKNNAILGKCLCFNEVYTPAAMAKKKITLLRMLNEVRLKKLESAGRILENIDVLYSTTDTTGNILLLNSTTQRFLEDIMQANIVQQDSTGGLMLISKPKAIEKLQRIIFTNISEITWEDTRNPYHFEIVTLHI